MTSLKLGQVAERACDIVRARIAPELHDLLITTIGTSIGSPGPSTTPWPSDL
ncbi:hypothetical protein [Actinoplanes friuliensis]|uniref:hypothetical protein n=1 Tax=Actinoplanes friuliensis TaxID=196914 RepID=UPI0003F6115E|nr:hypothetical protein [Actinoplanes friuliensis]